MTTYSNKYENICSSCVSRSLLIEWTHMLDKDRTSGLDTFNNNNNAKFPLYICNNHFELTVQEQQQSLLTRLKRWKRITGLPCFIFVARTDPVWTPQILTRACDKLSFRKINGYRRKCTHRTRATKACAHYFQAISDKIWNFYNFTRAL